MSQENPTEYEISLIARLAVAIDALEKIEAGESDPIKLATRTLNITDRIADLYK